MTIKISAEEKIQAMGHLLNKVQERLSKCRHKITELVKENKNLRLQKAALELRLGIEKVEGDHQQSGVSLTVVQQTPQAMAQQSTTA